MERSFGFYLVQYLLFIFNVVFLIAGLGLLGISVWALLDKEHLTVFIKTRLFTSGALFLLAVSLATIFISFFGCFGAIKRVRCVLTLFFVSLLLVFCAALSGVILMFLYRHDLSQRLSDAMRESMKNKYLYEPKNSSSIAIRDSWDWVQQTFRCCGVGENGSHDWSESFWFRAAKAAAENDKEEFPKVPKSCCVPAAAPGFLVYTNSSTFLNHDKCLGIGSYSNFGGPPITKILTTHSNEGLYLRGCHRAFVNIIADVKHLVVIVACVVGLILLLVIGMGLSCNLCRRLEEEDRVVLEEFKMSRP